MCCNDTSKPTFYIVGTTSGHIVLCIYLRTLKRSKLTATIIITIYRGLEEIKFKFREHYSNQQTLRFYMFPPLITQS